MLLICLAVTTVGAADLQKYDYRLLKIQKVSTMEQEMNEAAADGFAFQALLERNGQQLMLVMEKALDEKARGNKKYKLLSTSKTSTMQKELQEAGEAGFKILEMTVAETSFWGGHELVCILVKEE
jgi:uncharacterized glyoxalase superfamily protein PhnB